MNSPNIFVTSDTHYFHKNIIKYCNRPFKNVEEMNNTMISNWNKVVGKNDIVIHCGDFVFGNSNRVRNISKKLNGHIFLIRGNHDRVNKIKDTNVVLINSEFDKEPTLIIKNLIFSHRPLVIVPKNFVNVHGHVHEKMTFGHKINVCVEVCDYTPVSLEVLIFTAKNLLN